MTAGTPDDEELVRRYRAGTGEALDLLVERYLRRAVAVAYGFTADLDGAEDLVQEALERAVRSLPQFDDRQRFAPWFFTILRNVGRNERRRSSRMQSLDGIDAPVAGEPGSDVLDAELRRCVHRELAAMPPQQAGCFRLCEIEGFSAQEVGEMMGLAAPTDRTHVHRARLKLRVVLDRLGYRDLT